MKMTASGTSISRLLAAFKTTMSNTGSARRRQSVYAAESLETRVLPATFTVANLDDAGSGSLRQAIIDANNQAGADLIQFQAGLTGTITLTTGQLSITDSVTINGPGADKLAISANNAAHRVIHVDNGNVSLIDVSISGLTIRDGGDGVTSINGAGVQSGENLTLQAVTITGNDTANLGGGGIQIFGGNFVLQNSTVFGNRANQGGGVELFGASHVIINSTISGNTAKGLGGGLVVISGPTTVRNSTITGNRSDSDNSGADIGGGAFGNPGLLTLHNTIVAGNFRGTGSTPNDVGNSPTAGSSFNLIGDAGTAGGLINNSNGNVVGVNGAGTRDVATILNPALANNGGPTQTHALVTGSAAINAGSNAQALNNVGGALVNDQRGSGVPRIWNTTVDIGAVEHIAGLFVVDSTADENDGSAAAGDFSLREAIALSNLLPDVQNITFGSSLNGQTITLTGGELVVTESVNISSSFGQNLFISGNNASRIFLFGALGSQSYSLSGLTITGGNGTGQREQGFGGAIYLHDDFEGNDSLSLLNVRLQDNTADLGGAIFAVMGQLNVSSSFFLNNSATGTGTARGGGAIAIQESVAFVNDSTFTNNSAASHGGGIYNLVYVGGSGKDSRLALNGSSFLSNTAQTGGAISNESQLPEAGAYLQMNGGFISGNTATGDGGGLWSNSVVNVTGSTFSGNIAQSGGAFFNSSGMAAFTNSTISGNTASAFGGGLWNLNNASLMLNYTTVVLNRANSDGNATGVGGGLSQWNASVVAENSIFAGNVRGAVGADVPDDATKDPATTRSAFDPALSFNNLIGDPASAGGLTHNTRGNILGNGAGALRPLAQIVNPTLANNGGATRTHALAVGSPAIDRGVAFSDFLLKPTGVVSSTNATDLSSASGLLASTNLTLANYSTTDDVSSWVTNAPNGGSGNDYFANGTPAPVLTFSLDSVYFLTDVALWGYSVGGNNSNNDTKTIKLEFSTDGGTSYFGSLTLHKPKYTVGSFVHTLPFGTGIAANSVRMTFLDNWFGEPGSNAGDRVGLDEVRFLQRGLAPTADQRGGNFGRNLDGDHLSGAIPDIGAFESPGIRVISPSPNAFSLRPTFTWTAIEGATSYNIQINNESTGQAQFHLGSSNTTSYTPNTDLAIGKFRMWVRPVFGGTLGNWSAPHLFNNLTLATWTNMPRVQLTSRPTLTWNAQPGATKYEIWINNHSTGQQQLIRQEVTGTSFTPTTDLPIGNYRAWIRGKAADGTFGGWSVLYDALVVPGPTPIGPLSGTFDRTPTFSWNAVAGAVRYELYVRNLNTNAMVINGQSVNGTNFTPASNLTDGLHRWWTLAVGSAATNGMKSGGAVSTEIFVGGRPTLIAPAAGSSTSDRTPTFIWRAIDGAATYNLLVNRTDVAQAGVISQVGLAGTSFTPASNLAPGTYRAWVRAVSTTGELSPWSLEVNFTITDAQPAGDRTLDTLFASLELFDATEDRNPPDSSGASQDGEPAAVAAPEATSASREPLRSPPSIPDQKPPKLPHRFAEPAAPVTDEQGPKAQNGRNPAAAEEFVT